MSMKECYVFDVDGRFTGKVVSTTGDKRRAREYLREVTSTNVVLRYNVLLEAFRPQKMNW